MTQLWKDVGYGFRILIKNPVFTLVAVLTLALGIGANSAVFSLVYGVALRPLPYKDPQKIVFISEQSKRAPRMFVSFLNYLDWRDRNQVFEQMAAFRSMNYNLTGVDEPDRILGSQVTSNFFPMLGLNPVLGRNFTPDEDVPGAAPVALLSYRVWQRRFGGDPNIVGRTLTLNNEIFTVIGVMANNSPPSPLVDLWTSLGRISDAIWMKMRGVHAGTYVYARLKPSVTIEEAQRGMDDIAKQLQKEYPISNADNGIYMEDLMGWIVGNMDFTLYILWGAVGLVLLIACANIANLLLVRAAARQREFAIRTAMGATRGRIIGQLLTEIMVLAFCAGLLGLLFGYFGMEGLKVILPAGTPRLNEVHMSGWVFAFTLGVAVITGLLCSLAPTFSRTRFSLTEALKEGGRGATSSRNRLPQALMIVEVALSVMMLIGASLVVKSFNRLLNTDLGFDPAGVTTAQIQLPEADYGAPQKRITFVQQVLERLKALPGVEAASATSPLPLSGISQDSFIIEGGAQSPNQADLTDVARVSWDYFAAMKIRLLQGRYFNDQDTATSMPVAVVDETFAKTNWPGESALGKRIKIGRESAENPWLTVVGVVGHVRNMYITKQSRIETYLPYTQSPASAFTLVMRTSNDRSAIASSLRGVIREFDKNLPAFNIRGYDYYITDQMSSHWLSFVLFCVFGVIAVALTAIGTYGVLSYSVKLRTHEFGIRMAMGARAADVIKLVLRRGMILTLIGLAIGLIAAFALKRLISGLLFEVSSTDPMTFVGVPIFFAVVALLACLIPALRATRVDPLVLLRYQ